uniref:hypothetical protein n=1 Tax=Gelidibacter sp. TaxID=2018083 RepID=UPI00404A03F8
MKQSRLKLILFFLLSIIYSVTYSQITFGKSGTFANKWYEGELVLTNNDTLNGLVKFENASEDIVGFGSNKIKFKENEKAKTEAFKKDEVRHFIVTNNYDNVVKYAFINTSKNRKQLLEVLAEGKVSLYLKSQDYNMPLGRFDNSATQMTMPINHDLYYVKRENQKEATNDFFSSVFKSFKKTAANYFSDCPQVVSKINDETYVWKDLKTIVEEYNSCN